ncbi:MAG: HlyD family efflux transporter periplasmic adaptor subunit [Bryobacteraceae bacterium]|nr:HlyD family efflux transporter periplasmic adaptor subunit [Bryobacteraceae bacterium]
MSALLNPLPQPTPQAPLPQIAPPAPKTPSRGWMIALVIAAVAGIAGWRWMEARKAEEAAAALPVFKTAKVVVAPFEVRMRVSGQTSARNYANVTVPRMTGPEANRPLMLTKLAPGGVMVRPGTRVAEIDAQAMLDHIDDVHSTVLQAESDVAKRRAEQGIEWENLQQSLRVAKSTLDKAKIDAASGEVRTTIDQELMKLAVDEAQAAYDELRTDLGSKEASQKAELAVLQYTLERHRRHRDRHKKDAERFKVDTPLAGLVVMQSVYMGSEPRQIQEGDQVYSGQSILKVVAPNSMQVEGNISQADSQQFRVGQTADIALDAFPGVRLKGKIYSLGAIAAAGFRQTNYIRNVPVRVEIIGTDPRLIPDLSASADILLDQQPNAIQVPRAAVVAENGKHFVYVRKGSQFEKRAVELGPRNYTQQVVKTGVAQGEEVALNYTTPVVAKASAN